MIPIFNNWTTRSAGDVLADLSACRQLRHVGDGKLRTIAAECFGAVDAPRTFVWVYEAFVRAFARYGYICDTCDTVTKIEDHKWRMAADRALDNLDGRVKLMLCEGCYRQANQFTQKTFGRELRALYSDDLEKMMLAFIAMKTRKEAIKATKQHVHEPA